MKPTNAFQAFVVKALLDDPDVSAIVGDRVWDDVESAPIYPYCSVGPVHYNFDEFECIEYQNHFLQIDCWTQQQGRSDQINDLTDSVVRAINAKTGDLDPHALVTCNVSLVRVLDDPDGNKHGVVQIEGGIEII